MSLHLTRASHVYTQVEREKYVTDFQRNDTKNLGIYAARYLKCKFIFPFQATICYWVLTVYLEGRGWEEDVGGLYFPNYIMRTFYQHDGIVF